MTNRENGCDFTLLIFLTPFFFFVSLVKVDDCFYICPIRIQTLFVVIVCVLRFSFQICVLFVFFFFLAVS